ncbi:AraC family transcriptional regulator [uncultured Friedmanniella sp.]|uniref:AraC family transcriptional regulator n=1 Tax=uncultured Friedmanniella sp. TaxID=335381 RepID=UPI0035CB3FD6
MPYERVTISDGLPTAVGRILLAGQVMDGEPLMPRRLRTMDQFVVSVVTAGRGRYVDGDGRAQPIDPSTVTAVVPGVAHWYGTEPGHRWTEWFAVVEGPVFDLLVQTGRLAASGPRPLPRAARAEDLALLIRRPPPSSGAEAQVWAIAQWVARALTPDVAEDTALWHRAEALLVGDLRQPVSVPEVAAQLGLPYDAFRREFRRRFDRAPLTYRNERRLESAATLLALTNLTCREIARRLGFSDEFHLSHRFRSRYGVSPNAYRRSRAGG